MREKIFISGNFFFLLSFFVVNFCPAQWISDVRLTNDAAGSFMSYNNARCIATNGDVVHIVSFDNRDGSSEIYYKRSSDGGTSWGKDTRLTYDTAVSGFPSIAASGEFVHIVWGDYRDGNWEIYYKHSTDGGLSWEEDTRLTNDTSSSSSPSLSVSGLNVHTVWFDERDGNKEIYYKNSTDGGFSWSSDLRLTNDPAVSIFPSVIASDSSVHVAWEEYRGVFRGEIYYKKSTDEGITWGNDMRLTISGSKSLSPSISVSGPIVNVVWFDDRFGTTEILYKRSSDGGAFWGTDKRLTDHWASSDFPSITHSGSLVHVVWQDYRDGHLEIYYKSSWDYGITWGFDTRLTNNTANSIFPFIATAGPNIHVIWEEYRDGNPEIYYKLNPIGNMLSINVNITMIVEGFYNVTANCLNLSDTVTAYLRNINAPYSIVDSAKAVIDMFSLTGSFYFFNAPSGTYYIVIQHRNSIETWSKSGGIALARGPMSWYNFTSSNTQAFGNNMKKKGNRWTIFSGDVNKDGAIESTDIGFIENDAVNYVSGFKATDLNGDNYIDAADIGIADNNVFNFVSVVKPQ